MSSVVYRSPKKSGSVGLAIGFEEFVIDFASFPDSDESWTSDFCTEFCSSSSAVSSSFSVDRWWYSKELLSFLSENNLQEKKNKRCVSLPNSKSEAKDHQLNLRGHYEQGNHWIIHQYFNVCNRKQRTCNLIHQQTHLNENTWQMCWLHNWGKYLIVQYNKKQMTD